MPTVPEATSHETTPGSTQCRNCGTYVSSRFARVFGDNDDQVYRCIECSTLRALQQGAATEH